MSEKNFLEDLRAEEFRNLPVDAVVGSRDGKMLVIKRKLYWEILCACLGADPHSRYLCITYNENYLGKIFGPAVNSYTNYIAPADTIAKHYHHRFKEIFRVDSLDFSLRVSLKNVATQEQTELELGGQLVEFAGKSYLRQIVILEGIAHAVHNPHPERIALAVTTSSQHDADDVFPFANF